tara:strand:+ start:341 stop:1615 length:1275 start_codon:yes stop_codon:yes gene_type:complete
MATAAQIKSAVSRRGAAQRGITRQLAGVTEQLQKAEEASRLAKIKEEEIGRGYGTLFSALEVGATALEGIRQKQELESNIEAFEQSLPESVRQAGGVTVERGDRSSLMDVFTGTASMSDYLYGQEKYMLGERELGTKYDVAAMGEKAKAMRQGDLLDQFFGGEPLPKSTISRELGMERPSIDVTKLYGELEEKPSMMDKVGDKIERGTLVQSDGNIVPEKVVSDVEKKIETKEIFGPPKPKNESLSEFLKEEDKVVIDDTKYDPSDESLTEEQIPSFAKDKAISEPFQKPLTENFSKLLESERRGPEFALADIGERIEEISKLESGEGVINPQTRKNFLERAKTLKEELKQDILSIYNPKTGQFKSEEFEKIFTEGTGRTGEKEGFAKVSKRRALGLQSIVDVDLDTVETFIGSLFNENNLASK